ncbi:MAG: hypothetical protein V2A55_00185 [Candidatus Jorgensenbacteria bacterium]
MRNKSFWVIIFALLLVTGYQLLVTDPAHALELDVITSPDTTITDESIADYIVRLYWFAVGAAGAVAVAVIVGGAIYYMVSSGSPDKQSEAKSYITSALWGVALLLGSYFILNTINPQITALKPPGGDWEPCNPGERPGIDCMPEVPKTLPVCGEGATAGTSTRPGIDCLPACKASERACGIGEVAGDKKLGDVACIKCAYSPYVAPEGIGCDAACFYDPEDKTSCDFEDPSAVCTTIDKRTSACLPGNPSRVYPCVCENCKIIPDEIPIKAGNTCLSSTLGKCFLEESIVERLENVFEDDFIQDNFGSNKWRITEAFPPTANHASPQHYNGRAIDMAPASVSDQCNQALDIAKRFAQADFNTVLIEGPKGSCSPVVPDETGEIPGVPGVKRYVNNVPFHIHVAK